MSELQLSLVDRCRNGDADAWRDLVGQYSAYVYAIVVRAYRIPRDDAEDLFQEVFARVFERLEMLRDDAALQAWIGQVTRNLCIDHQRRSRPTGELPETLESDGQRELDELTEALYVQQALAELSGECADILDRFFRRDQPYRTIAAETGLAEGTIASRISRCLARLRDVIEGRSGRAPASGGT